MINRVGKLKLFRWRDGSRTLTLRVDDDEASRISGTIHNRRPPKLPRWECHFIGRHADYTTFSYRRLPREAA